MRYFIIMERKSLNKTQILQIIKGECYKLDYIKILNVYLSKDATKKEKKGYILEEVVCSTM